MTYKKICSIALGFMLTFSTIMTSNADQKFTRYSGENRYETSMETQKYINSDILVIASGNNYVDSLSAINLCNSLNAKLVLIDPTDSISHFLKQNKFSKIYIVGGEKSVPYSYEEYAKTFSVPVIRVAGKDRYQTNKATLKEAKLKNVGLATGSNYVDALSATKFLKEKKLGLLLYDNLNPKDNLGSYVIKYVIGNESSVPIKAGKRIAGKNSYETAIELSKLTNAKNSVVVSSENFADALSAINISNGKDAAVFMAPNIGDVKNEGSSLKSGEIFVVGGQNALSDNQVKYAITGVVSDELKNEYKEKIEKQNEEKLKYIEKKNDQSRIDHSAKKGYYEVMALPTEIIDVDANKAPMKNHVVKLKGNKHYLLNLISGEIITNSKAKNGIVLVEDRAFLLNQDNSLSNGLVNSHGKTYFQTYDKGLYRGWKSINGYLYYFSPMNYNMYKGHAKSTGLSVYWFGEDGKVRAGYKPSGKRNRPILYYGPTKDDLKNSWILRPDAKKRFIGQEVVNFAAEHEGLPFKWFGCNLRDKSGVYCCGSAYSALHEYGVKVPGPNDSDFRKDDGYRMVKDQYTKAEEYGGKHINMDYNILLPGDQLFTRSKNRPYHHVMLYMGKNNNNPLIVHATIGDGYVVNSAYEIPTIWKHTFLNPVRWLN